MSAQRLLVGRIAGAHGLKGEVKITSFTGAPEDIGAYGPLTDVGGTRRFVLSELRLFKPGVVIARVNDSRTRDEAEALRGIELFLDRGALPPTEEDEFYHSDLIGLSAVSPQGEVIGRISAIHDFGAGDILEISPGSGAPTLLVPFTRVNVPEIDIPAGRLTVIPLETDEDVTPPGQPENDD